MRGNFDYRLALAYAALGALGWLVVGLRQWIFRLRYMEGAARFYAEGDGERARRAMEIAGGRSSEALIALAVAAVFLLAVGGLLLRTWNAWDWATAGVGIATVLSSILLCASGRVIFAAPFTLAPLWVLLYRPGVKAASGVATASEAATGSVGDEPPRIEDLDEERRQLVGLRQSLQVFEIERGMPTDMFVDRYAQGLEDDSADNEEWFALARMARRAEERLTGLNGRQAPQR